MKGKLTEWKSLPTIHLIENYFPKYIKSSKNATKNTNDPILKEATQDIKLTDQNRYPSYTTTTNIPIKKSGKWSHS